jgi:hypothetical protein
MAKHLTPIKPNDMALANSVFTFFFLEWVNIRVNLF